MIVQPSQLRGWFNDSRDEVVDIIVQAPAMLRRVEGYNAAAANLRRRAESAPENIRQTINNMAAEIESASNAMEEMFHQIRVMIAAAVDRGTVSLSDVPDFLIPNHLRGLRGLGVIPFIVIGVAIAIVAVGTAAAYSLIRDANAKTATHFAQADAYANAAAASLRAWENARGEPWVSTEEDAPPGGGPFVPPIVPNRPSDTNNQSSSLDKAISAVTWIGGGIAAIYLLKTFLPSSR